MHGTLRLITPAVGDPLMIDIARQHLRQDQVEDDAMIALYLKAAVESVEAETGRVLMPQTWEYSLPWDWRCGWQYTGAANWYDRTITLPIAPVLSVDEIRVGGSVVEPSGYRATLPSGPTGGRATITLDYAAGWPADYSAHDALTVTFRAGYAPATLPFGLQAAVLLSLTSLYENRAAEAETGGGSARSLSANPAYTRLIRPFQLIG